MAKLFSAREIASLALRNVGVIGPQDTSAPEQKLLVALQYLDLYLGEVSGSERLWFFVPQELSFTYPAEAESVDLTALLGANNLDMVRYAYINETDEEITLVRRDEFDRFQHGGSYPLTPGRFMYIATEGDDTYTAYLRTVPAQAVTIRLMGQKLSPSVSNAVQSSSEAAHGFERAWQFWMVNRLSSIIGNGPLARLPESRLDTYRAEAQNSWDRLKAYRSGGQRKAGRFTKSWGL